MLNQGFFADDTNLFLCHKTLICYKSFVMNLLIVYFSGWLQNKLSINITKTNYPIYNPHPKYEVRDMCLKINNEQIERADSVRYVLVTDFYLHDIF